MVITKCLPIAADEQDMGLFSFLFYSSIVLLKK